jgi:hypothetical protein
VTPTLNTTSQNAALMNAINSVFEDNEENITLPMTAVNEGIAALSKQTSSAIVKLGNTIVKSIVQGSVDNDNAIESLGTAILQPLYDWQAENDLLLNHLASAAGLIQPGDPLTQALVTQATEQPELALSAVLLLALQQQTNSMTALVEVLREIRDRLPGVPAEFAGESKAKAAAIQEPADLAATLADIW